MDPNDKTLEKAAEAAAEVAKFGTQAITTSERILAFTARVFKEPAEQASGIIGDRLRLYRWERQLAYVEKVNSILEARKLSETRAVPPKFALPILEGASLEEDDSLQALWASLMANAMDPSFPSEIRVAYIEIIKGISALDARMLKKIYDTVTQNNNITPTEALRYMLTKEQICAWLNITSDTYEVSVFNLFRVQCLAPAVVVSSGISFGGEAPTAYKGSQMVTMTPLGMEFVVSAMQERLARSQ